MWSRRDFLKSVAAGVVTPLVMQSAAMGQDAQAKLVLVMGGCGTGKTAFARMLASRKNCILIDEGLSMWNLPQKLVPPWADEQWCFSGERAKEAHSYMLMLRRKYVAERSTTVIITIQTTRSMMLPCSFSMLLPCDLVYSTKRIAPGLIQTTVVKDRYSRRGERTQSQYRVGRGLSLTEV